MEGCHAESRFPQNRDSAAGPGSATLAAMFLT